MISGLDIYDNYAEVNETFDLPEHRRLSNDRNVEDPKLIVGVRKWSWEAMDADGPNLSCLGLVSLEHVVIHDKYDIFIY